MSLKTIFWTGYGDWDDVAIDSLSTIADVG